jgi:hypothetical protein
MVVSKFLLVVIIIVLTSSSFFITIVSSFESSSTNNNGRFSRITKQLSRRHRAFVLGGTIKFVGNANARLSIPSPTISINNNVDDKNDKENRKSLSKFLTSPASDTVLLGKTSTCTRIEDEKSTNQDEGEGGELWECRQASVSFFGMQISPVFTNRLERSTTMNEVTITLLDSTSEVEGGRLGNTLASVMKKSKFEGRNTITWKEVGVQQEEFLLEGKLNLTLTITLPPFLPLPPGFNAIGSKIVERTCAERLKQNLVEVSDAYQLWTREDNHHHQ